MTEEELIQGVRRGDAAAFAELVRLHQAKIRAFLAMKLLDDAVADDVAQEVFLAAARGIHRFSGDASLATWLVGIARNLALQHWRKERRLRRRHALAQLFQAEPVHDPGDRPEELAASLERLEGCLERLAPASRHVIERHYFVGETLATLATNLGRKPSALRMNLMRIRQALRACLEGDRAMAGGDTAP